MLKYSIKRFGQLVVIMLLISFFSFAVIYFAPGDASSLYISPDMTEEQKTAIIADLGLNQGMLQQYIGWAKRAIQGDFGISLANKTPVTPQLLNKLPATLLLMGSSLVLSVVLAVPLGLIAGRTKNSILDNLISGIAYVGMSLPSFAFGMLLIIVFTARLRLLPSSGMRTGGVNSTIDLIRHMIMPCLTLSMANLARYIRYIRANAIGQLSEEYVLTAKAKGTSDLKILFHHVLKNTLLPIITLLGMDIATLVCGSFIVETVFGWPGVGMTVMSAINARDYPVIMAYVMLSGLILVVGNFAADILYAVVDPRIRRGME
ncbi:MAG: ABC transporter permease [Eubacteriales bacterium]|nr:ABC transporter permease [Eubacteriales bacterium]